MLGGQRAISPQSDDTAGRAGTGSRWKLGFGRKLTNKSNRKGQDDGWDDYQRGIASARDGTRAGNDPKLMAMLGMKGDPRAGNSSRDIMADLRETAYLPLPGARDGARATGSRGKSERWMGSELASSPRLAPASRSSSLSLRRETSSGSMIPSQSVTSCNDINTLEADCPVCLEPMSYRLAGEKPHVMPNCGHALHNACFTAVYGHPEAVMVAQRGGGGPPGMCGVCRKAIILGEEEAGGKGTKLAGMMGSGGSAGEPLYKQSTDGYGDSDAKDITLDDPIESKRPREAAEVAMLPGGYSKSSFPRAEASLRQGMVHPIIRVRPEYSALYRKDPTGQNAKQNIVCVVSIEVPSRRPPLTEEEEEIKDRIQWRTLGTVLNNSPDDSRESNSAQTANSGLDDEAQKPAHSTQQQRSFSPQPLPLADQSHAFHPANEHATAHDDDDDTTTVDGGCRQPTKESDSSSCNGHQQSSYSQSSDGEDEGFSFGVTPAAHEPSRDHPHATVLAELRHRITDWKGQTVERFGDLILYDYLGVRQEAIVRNFWVYLFSHALLCVTEERKKERGLARLKSASTSSVQANGSRSSEASLHRPSAGPKPALKLKGRIWLRHISRVQDSSSEGNLILSIQLDDESLDHFILCFSERSTLEIWKAKLSSMVGYRKPQVRVNHLEGTPSKQSGGNLTTSNPMPDSLSQDIAPATANLSIARRSTAGSVMSGKSGSTAACGYVAPHPNGGFSNGTNAVTPSVNTRSVVDNLRRASRIHGNGSTGIPIEQQWSASGGLDPSRPPPPLLAHTPLDLILMVSVPVVVQQHQSSVSSSAALKLRLIRSTLEFVASHMGPHDRLSIVSFTTGHSGEVRRTALLNTSRAKSRQKLFDFVEGIGRPWSRASEDPYRVDGNKLGGASERTDTVTALNVGLDVVLSRKSKNPCTGMILINDTSDGPVRGQMDLVMARAEVANVPIHCFGFGKSSNPSSLWLVSNHTRGSYTFVKEWYQLRDCIAGCVGSLMSTALDQFKLYLSVPSDNHFKVRKVSGPPGAIISSSGKEVDLELGELRFGEVRELIIELEVDFNGLVPFLAQINEAGKPSFKRLHNAPAIEHGSATEDFMQRLGLSNLSLTESDQGDSLLGGDADALDNLIEEVAVFEIDAGYRDPGAGTSLARIPNPTVLTIEVDANSLESGVQGRAADPVVTRRRIEILVSEMITRSLLLVSRKNYSQALRIVNETHKIVETVLRALSTDDSLGLLGGNGAGSVGAGGSHRQLSARNDAASPAARQGASAGILRSAPARQRMMLHRQAIASLLAILDDLELISTGLEAGQRPQFERDGRNAAAQQAMVLRDQQAWTTRTATEALRFLADNGPCFAAHAFAASRA